MNCSVNHLKNKDPSVKVLLIGHYGRGNLGDRLMLNGLRKLAPEGCSITVAGGQADMVPENLLSITRQLARSDWLWLGGGSMFNDLPRPLTRKFRSLLKMAALTFLGRIMNVKIAWVGVGVGPIETWFGRKLAHYCLKRTSFCSVRDHVSLEWIKKAGHKASIIPDLALAGTQEGSPPQNKETFTLGINIFPYFHIYHDKPENDHVWIKKLADILIRLKECTNKSISFRLFAFSDKVLENDMEALVFLNRIIMAGEISQPEHASQVISACDGILSMRYHASLVSAYASRPTIALAYHPKCLVLDKIIGMNEHSLLLWPDSNTFESLEELLFTMISNPERFIASFNAKELQNQLRQNALPGGISN